MIVPKGDQRRTMENVFTIPKRAPCGEQKGAFQQRCWDPSSGQQEALREPLLPGEEGEALDIGR